MGRIIVLAAVVIKRGKYTTQHMLQQIKLKIYLLNLLNFNEGGDFDTAICTTH